MVAEVNVTIGDVLSAKSSKFEDGKKCSRC
jgi:hypothetical protein